MIPEAKAPMAPLCLATVVVINRNGRQFLADCLTALERQTLSANASAALAADPAPSALSAPARLTAQPAVLAHDLSSPVLTTYVAFAGVAAAGLAFALGRRSRRFGGSA